MPRKALSPEETARRRALALENKQKRETAGAHAQQQQPTTRSSSPPPGAAVEMLTDETLEIEIRAEETSVPPLSLKDRLFGARSAGTPGGTPAIKKAPGGRGKKPAPDNLITSVLPTVIASFIATYSRHLLPEEYKRCAPSMEECNGVLGPLLAMIGRRVEIVGKASQDVLDLTNSIICALAYSTRAYITYIDIKREQPTRRTDQEQDTRASGPGGNSNEDGQSTINRSNGLSSDQASNSKDGRKEATVINDLFERDKRGRISLGLLPN